MTIGDNDFQKLIILRIGSGYLVKLQKEYDSLSYIMHDWCDLLDFMTMLLDQGG